jgi:hypothetical protein
MSLKLVDPSFQGQIKEGYEEEQSANARLHTFSCIGRINMMLSALKLLLFWVKDRPTSYS